MSPASTDDTSYVHGPSSFPEDCSTEITGTTLTRQRFPAAPIGPRQRHISANYTVGLMISRAPIKRSLGPSYFGGCVFPST